jgi:hypothetical protein
MEQQKNGKAASPDMRPHLDSSESVTGGRNNGIRTGNHELPKLRTSWFTNVEIQLYKDDQRDEVDLNGVCGKHGTKEQDVKHFNRKIWRDVTTMRSWPGGWD